MKKCLAFVLTCSLLCMSFVGAQAAPLTTEGLLGEILGHIDAQLTQPGFSFEMSDGDEWLDVRLGSDADGLPGFTAGNQVQRLTVDRQGIRVDDAQGSTGVRYAAIWEAVVMQVLELEELPEGVEQDLTFVTGLVLQILQESVAQATEVTQTPIEDGGSRLTTVRVELKTLLQDFDKAMQTALETHGEMLDAMLLKYGEFLRTKLSVPDALLSTKGLLQSWKNLGLQTLLPIDIAATLRFTGTGDLLQPWKLEAETIGVSAVMEFSGTDLSGTFALGGTEFVFDTRDVRTLLEMAADLPQYIPRSAFEWQNTVRGSTLDVRLRMNANQIMEYAFKGAAAIIHKHQDTVEQLLQRYFPWAKLLGGADVGYWTCENLIQMLNGPIYWQIYDSLTRTLPRWVGKMMLCTQEFYMTYPENGGLPFSLFFSNGEQQLSIEMNESNLNASFSPDLRHSYHLTGTLAGGRAVASLYENYRDYNYLLYTLATETTNEGMLKLELKQSHNEMVYTASIGAKRAHVDVSGDGVTGDTYGDLVWSDDSIRLTLINGNQVSTAGLWVDGNTLFVDATILGTSWTGQIRLLPFDVHTRLCKDGATIFQLRKAAQALFLELNIGEFGEQSIVLDADWNVEHPRLFVSCHLYGWAYMRGNLLYTPGSLTGNLQTKAGNWQLILSDADREDSDVNQTHIYISHSESGGGWLLNETFVTHREEDRYTMQITREDQEPVEIVLDFSPGVFNDPVPSDCNWLTGQQLKTLLFPYPQP